MPASKSNAWQRLDNAAKIFPPTTGKRDTKVFRFACELYEPVDPQILQAALDKTVEAFPFFQSVLRKGLFWYYLERCSLRPTVLPETEPPCSSLYDQEVKRLLFQVTYFEERINFEVYHALTDGTGALQFLRMLVYQYILRRHPEDFGGALPPFTYDASLSQKEDDSFQKYYTNTKHAFGPKKPRACRIRGQHVPFDRIRVTEGHMPVKQVMEIAHRYNATLTVLLTALLMQSINATLSQRERRRPVVVTIPVNLRNYFPSASARNFFSIFEVGHRFDSPQASLEELIQELSAHFQQELTLENLCNRLNLLTSIEHNIFTRITPLALKDICLSIAGSMSEAKSTASLSNIGRISMPDGFERYIRLFDVFVSTEKVQICMCSYRDHLTISFSSAFAGAEVEKNFFRALTQMGVEVEIVSTPPEPGNGNA